MSVTIVTEQEIRAVADLDMETIETVESAFAELGRGRVVMPPILRLDIEDHNGEVDVKTAYVPGMDSFAIKVSPGFFDNPKLGLPSLNGLMVLFSAHTGLVEAVLLDNGYLTDLRTAAAGAVAARHLALREARTAGVLGAGMQARLQAEALCLVRNIERLTVWARDRAKAEAYAAEMSKRLGIEVSTADSPEAVVRECQIVITTTPSRSPLVEPEWLHPGLHITAMGSDAEHKNELAPKTVAAASLFVCDRREQSRRLGELHHALASGAVGEDFPAAELGEVIVGRHPGRRGSEDITICDLTGTGAQDTAIAIAAFAKARAAGKGTTV